MWLRVRPQGGMVCCASGAHDGKAGKQFHLKCQKSRVGSKKFIVKSKKSQIAMASSSSVLKSGGSKTCSIKPATQAKKPVGSKCVRPSALKSAVPSRSSVPTNKNGALPKKGARQPVKKPHRVQILDPNSIESAPPPAVQVENETCHINIEGRISQAIGLAGRKSLGIIQQCKEEEPVPVAVGEMDLNQPTYQSCQALMKTLEKMKNLEIDTSSLAKLKIQKDKNLQESLNRKVLFTHSNLAPTIVCYNCYFIYIFKGCRHC